MNRLAKHFRSFVLAAFMMPIAFLHLPGFSLSLEKVGTLIIGGYVALLVVTRRAGTYRIPNLVLFFPLVTSAIVLFAGLFQDNQDAYFQFSFEVIYNQLLGAVFYIAIRNFDASETERLVRWMFLVFVVSFAFYVWESGGFAGALIVKSQAVKAGFNPNAALNVALLFLILYVLLLRSKSPRLLDAKWNSMLIWIGIPTGIILLVSMMQLSRQNSIAALLVMMLVFMRYWVLAIPLIVGLLWEFYILLTKLNFITYLVKGVGQLQSFSGNTRYDWWADVLSTVSPTYIGGYIFPVDNSLLTSLSMFGLILGSVFIVPQLAAFAVLARRSVFISAALFTLWMFQDIFGEASYWAIFFLTLSSTHSTQAVNKVAPDLKPKGVTEIPMGAGAAGPPVQA